MWIEVLNGLCAEHDAASTSRVALADQISRTWKEVQEVKETVVRLKETVAKLREVVECLEAASNDRLEDNTRWERVFDESYKVPEWVPAVFRDVSDGHGCQTPTHAPRFAMPSVQQWPGQWLWCDHIEPHKRTAKRLRFTITETRDDWDEEGRVIPYESKQYETDDEADLIVYLFERKSGDPQ